MRTVSSNSYVCVFIVMLMQTISTKSQNCIKRCIELQVNVHGVGVGGILLLEAGIYIYTYI